MTAGGDNDRCTELARVRRPCRCLSTSEAELQYSLEAGTPCTSSAAIGAGRASGNGTGIQVRVGVGGAEPDVLMVSFASGDNGGDGELHDEVDMLNGARTSASEQLCGLTGVEECGEAIGTGASTVEEVGTRCG